MPQYGFSLTRIFPYSGIFYAVLMTRKFSNFSLLSTDKVNKHYTNYSKFHFILDMTENPKLSFRNFEVLKDALQKLRIRVLNSLQSNMPWKLLWKCLNPTLANIPILYLLKTPKKLFSSGVFRVHKTEALVGNRLMLHFFIFYLFV